MKPTFIPSFHKHSTEDRTVYTLYIISWRIKELMVMMMKMMVMTTVALFSASMLTYTMRINTLGINVSVYTMLTVLVNYCTHFYLLQHKDNRDHRQTASEGKFTSNWTKQRQPFLFFKTTVHCVSLQFPLSLATSFKIFINLFHKITRITISSNRL